MFPIVPDGKMMAVAVSRGDEFGAGTPTPLFQTPSGAIGGDVTADGKRFLLIAPLGSSGTVPFTVVLNWQTGLKL
jgi:hypothetical protein